MNIIHFLVAPPPENDGPTEAELEEKWDDGVSGELSAIFQGRSGTELPQDVLPFDAASQVDIEQQRYDDVK